MLKAAFCFGNLFLIIRVALLLKFKAFLEATFFLHLMPFPASFTTMFSINRAIICFCIFSSKSRFTRTKSQSMSYTSNVLRWLRVWNRCSTYYNRTIIVWVLWEHCLITFYGCWLILQFVSFIVCLHLSRLLINICYLPSNLNPMTLWQSLTVIILMIETETVNKSNMKVSRIIRIECSPDKNWLRLLFGTPSEARGA